MAQLNPRADSVGRYTLGNDAYKYVSSVLHEGGPIAAELVRRKALEEVFTFLPTGVLPERLLEFKWGGYWTKGETLWLDWIEDRLSAIPGGIALGENFELKLGSALLARMPPFVVTDGYITFVAESSRTSLEAMFTAMSRYPSIVIVTAQKSLLLSGESIDRQRLISLVDAAEYVLVGAYDEESFICARCARTVD